MLCLQNPRHIEQVKLAVKKNAQSIKETVAELEPTLDAQMRMDTTNAF